MGKKCLQYIHPTKDTYSEYKTLEKDMCFNLKKAKDFKDTS